MCNVVYVFDLLLRYIYISVYTENYTINAVDMIKQLSLGYCEVFSCPIEK